MKLENLKFGDRYVLANGKMCVCVKVAHNLKSGDFLFKQSNFLNGTEAYTTIQIDVETGKWIGGNDDKFSIIAKYERPYLWTQTVFGDMFLTKGGVNAVYVSETEVEYEDLNNGRRYKKENATYIVADGGYRYVNVFLSNKDGKHFSFGVGKSCMVQDDGYCLDKKLVSEFDEEGNEIGNFFKTL